MTHEEALKQLERCRYFIFKMLGMANAYYIISPPEIDDPFRHFLDEIGNFVENNFEGEK